MTVQIVHIGDLHFGGLADVSVVEALERMLPDLRPDAIVIGGDLSQRARHGEFQRGRAFERSPPMTMASGRRSGSIRSSASTTGTSASPPKCRSPI